MNTSQMAAWNGEAADWNPYISGSKDAVMKRYKKNFLQTQLFAMIKAEADSVVVPREGEWWGQLASDYGQIIPMRETSWYLVSIYKHILSIFDIYIHTYMPCSNVK